MKFLYILPLACLILFACNKEEEEPPAPMPAEDPNFNEFAIVKSVSLENEAHPAFSRLVVDFSYPLGSEVTIGVDSVKYRAKFEAFSSQEADFSEATYRWNDDSTQLIVEPRLSLPPDVTMTLRVESSWERLIGSEWIARYGNTFPQAIAIDPLPSILGQLSITEGRTGKCFCGSHLYPCPIARQGH